MAGRLRWVLATVLAMLIIAVPAVRYRVVYSTEKRFREVTPGKFYRCGQMSADAFRKLIPNGYGDRKATTANDYIYEYLYLYQPRARGPEPGVRSQKDSNPRPATNP